MISGTFCHTTSTGARDDFRFQLGTDGRCWMLIIGDLRAVHLGRADNGDLVVEREEDWVDKARVEYDPALVVLPASIDQGSRRKGTVKMVVKSLDGATVRDRGTCWYSVEVIWRATIAVPGGRFQACLVREQRHIKLALGLFSTKRWQRLVRVD